MSDRNIASSEEEAYRDALVQKGLLLEDAVAIAAKTITKGKIVKEQPEVAQPNKKPTTT